MGEPILMQRPHPVDRKSRKQKFIQSDIRNFIKQPPNIALPRDDNIKSLVQSDSEDSGPGFSKDFSKVMTILANEVIIAGPIGPAIYI